MRFKLFLALSLSIWTTPNLTHAQKTPFLQTILNSLKPGTSNVLLTYKGPQAHQFIIWYQDRNYIQLELEVSDLESLKRINFKSLPRVWGGFARPPASQELALLFGLINPSAVLANHSEWFKAIEEKIKETSPNAKDVRIEYIGEGTKIGFLEIIPSPPANSPLPIDMMKYPNAPDYFSIAVFLIDSLGNKLRNLHYKKGGVINVNHYLTHTPVPPRTKILALPVSSSPVAESALEKIRSLPLHSNIEAVLGPTTTQTVLNSHLILEEPTRIEILKSIFLNQCRAGLLGIKGFFSSLLKK